MTYEFDGGARPGDDGPARSMPRSLPHGAQEAVRRVGTTIRTWSDLVRLTLKSLFLAVGVPAAIGHAVGSIAIQHHRVSSPDAINNRRRTEHQFALLSFAVR